MENKSVGVATKGVILNEKGQFLILKKSDKEDINPNTYDLPGGRLEFGEKPEAGLHREIKEETGLEVEILTIFNTWTFVKDENFQLVGVDFLCKLTGGTEKLSGEHDEFLWVDSSAVESKNLPEWLIGTLKKAEKYKSLFFQS